jgi:hypothetical protein
MSREQCVPNIPIVANTDAEHTSLFGPMNMTADEPASDLLPAASPGAIPFVARARETRASYILWKPNLFSSLPPEQPAPFLSAASEQAIQAMISEGAPLQKETPA